MKREDRPYQGRAIARVVEHFRAGRRKIVLVSPTGSGKTWMAGRVIEGALAKGNKVLFLAHRKELIDQPSRLLDEIGIDHGIIKADHWRKRAHLPVQVASIQTLINRETPEAQVVIIDETHRCLAKTYRKIIDLYPKALLLGLTATPWRLDGKGLGAMYDAIVPVATIKELTQLGFLTPMRVFAPFRPDLRGVARSGGDYALGGLSAIMRRGEIVGGIVEKWLETSPDRRTIVFACSVDHSNEIVGAFRAADVRAEHLDGTTPDGRRESILARLASGETQVVVNVDVLTEGYDLPAIKCVVLARPTKSLTKYLQMVGRSGRIYEGYKDAIILDHAGCVYEHGMPDEDREWTLEDVEVKARQTSFELEELRKCPECSAVIEKGGPCTFCGARRIRMLVPVEVDGELREVEQIPRCPACKKTRVTVTAYDTFRFRVTCREKDCREISYQTDHARAHAASLEEKRREWMRLEVARSRYGHKPGWTFYKYRDTFGEPPPKEWKSA